METDCRSQSSNKIEISRYALLRLDAKAVVEGSYRLEGIVFGWECWCELDSYLCLVCIISHCIDRLPQDGQLWTFRAQTPSTQVLFDQSPKTRKVSVPHKASARRLPLFLCAETTLCFYHCSSVVWPIFHCCLCCFCETPHRPWKSDLTHA